MPDIVFTEGIVTVLRAIYSRLFWIENAEKESIAETRIKVKLAFIAMLIELVYFLIKAMLSKYNT